MEDLAAHLHTFQPSEAMFGLDYVAAAACIAAATASFAAVAVACLQFARYPRPKPL